MVLGYYSKNSDKSTNLNDQVNSLDDVYHKIQWAVF